jgi:hypothetical protein
MALQRRFRWVDMCDTRPGREIFVSRHRRDCRARVAALHLLSIEMASTQDIKTRLRKMRDKLAFEVPRARVRPATPPELVERLNAALETVTNVCLLTAASGTVEEIQEDALVEAHLVLHEWERCLELQNKPPQKSRGTEQRRHPRLETNVSVKLQRHAVRGHGGTLSVETDTITKPARNVSLDGIYVLAAPAELGDVAVGGVVHLSVVTTLGGTLSFHARAVVVRRDQDGVGLRWVRDTPAIEKAIASLLDAISRARSR